jgi:hypothetical protein
MTYEIKPVLGDPGIIYADDEEGEYIPCTPTAGWDITFGCRMNFGWDEDGALHVSVHVSDQTKQSGVALRSVTPKQLEVFADQLKLVARAGLTPMQAHLAADHGVSNAYFLNDAQAREVHAIKEPRHSEWDVNPDITTAVEIIRKGLAK